MRKSTLIVLCLALTLGCGSSAPPHELPATPKSVLRTVPDFAPKPGEIPVPGDFPSTDLAFRVNVSTRGELFRDGMAVSLSSIINEVRALSDVENTTILIEGDSNVRMSVILKLQADLSDAIPNLGAVVIGVHRVPDGG